ncbi:peptidase S8 and S53, subtilisin, kexin,sedolisin [Sphingobium sp. SCG-1]|uniref:S8 family peptidase n=1 Tax=Sphingobium sp. SCG-1 TaxID=2072936 RepID=UPI000CD686CA|nr:S8 family peptidase [Sphingobium sp. SCG-1]AUW57344.1 peptidase S8 and S53, subtilisin, kexin,sedolisin [Sphingobium sp. SCG-1]
MRNLLRSVSILALSSLSACGGGGSSVNSGGTQAPVASPTPAVTPAPDTSTSNPTPTPTPAPGTSIVTPANLQSVRSANDTAEYRQNYTASELIHGLYALDSGWTGKGVTVGVLDDGVNTSLSAFSGQISSLSKDFGTETTNGVTAKRDRLGDAQADHGTAIAAIIAGKKDGSGTMGVAPDAQIAVLRTSDYNVDTKTEVLTHDAEALDYASSVGIKIINRSLTSQGFNVSIRNAVERYAVGGGLLVNAAGNQGSADPTDAVNVNNANRDAWLFVVALDPTSQSTYALASYSNKAGTLADRTVTSPGTNYTTRVDGSVSAFSGTSSATAQVSALAALIVSKWPQLSGVEAGNVILSTARDIGDPGVDTVFGHGLIDAEAALSPVNPVISNGSKQTLLAESVMVVPEALNTSSIQTALSQVTILDEYGRDFSGSVASMVVKPGSGNATWLRRRIAQMASGGGSSFNLGKLQGSVNYATYRYGMDRSEVRSVMRAGEINYQDGRTGYHVGINAGDSLQSDIMGLAPFADGILAYAPQAGNSFGVDRSTGIGRLGLTLSTGSFGSARASAATVSLDTGRTSIRASWIDEKGSVLGVASSGGLALGRGTNTAMVEAHHSLELAGGWSLEGYGSVGVTRLKIDPLSVVTASTSLVGTRAGLQASRAALGGLVSFGIAQPLTIESGKAKLTLASAYDLASQSLVFRSTNASLSSTRRPLQLTAGFARGDAVSNLRIGMMQNVTDGSTTALAGYSFRF